jgi:hypothetical protein
MITGPNASFGQQATTAPCDPGPCDLSTVTGTDGRPRVAALPSRWWCSIDLERSESDATLRIVVRGVLDNVSLPVLRDRLAAAASLAGLVEVDLGEVTFASIEVALLLLGPQAVQIALVGASRPVERAVVAARQMMATADCTPIH